MCEHGHDAPSQNALLFCVVMFLIDFWEAIGDTANRIIQARGVAIRFKCPFSTILLIVLGYVGFPLNQTVQYLKKMEK